MQDFLNPKSMVTPGVSGAMVMAIAGALWVNFAIEPRWSALLLSFLVCSFIFSSLVGPALAGMPTLWRVVLYLFNSLIVFAIATGTNVGVRAAVGAQTADQRTGFASPQAFELLPFSEARAQGGARVPGSQANTTVAAQGDGSPAAAEEVARLQARIRQLEFANAQLLRTHRAASAPAVGASGVAPVVAPSVAQVWSASATGPRAATQAAQAAAPDAKRRFTDPWF